MVEKKRERQALALIAVLMLAVVGAARSQYPQTIFQAILGELGQPTLEVSTEELQRILAETSATVFDVRPHREFAISHIPGALNAAPKPGVPMSLYVSDVAEIGRLAGDDKDAPIVLYCNGPFCGKSKRVAAELLEAGYSNVRRYQLGIPVWRALGGVTEIELGAIQHVLSNDRTAVLIDVREPEEHRAEMIPGAGNIPRSAVLEGKDVGEIKRAKDDGRLPMEDHNTRILVLGSDAIQARYVAEALVREAFHNVSYFPGSFDQVQATLRP